MIKHWGWIFLGIVIGFNIATMVWGWVARNTSLERKRLVEKIVIPLQVRDTPQKPIIMEQLSDAQREEIVFCSLDYWGQD